MCQIDLLISKSIGGLYSQRALYPYELYTDLVNFLQLGKGLVAFIFYAFHSLQFSFTAVFLTEKLERPYSSSSPTRLPVSIDSKSNYMVRFMSNLTIQKYLDC